MRSYQCMFSKTSWLRQWLYLRKCYHRCNYWSSDSEAKRWCRICWYGLCLMQEHCSFRHQLWQLGSHSITKLCHPGSNRIDKQRIYLRCRINYNSSLHRFRSLFELKSNSNCPTFCLPNLGLCLAPNRMRECLGSSIRFSSHHWSCNPMDP